MDSGGERKKNPGKRNMRRMLQGLIASVNVRFTKKKETVEMGGFF